MVLGWGVIAFIQAVDSVRIAGTSGRSYRIVPGVTTCADFAPAAKRPAWVPTGGSSRLPRLDFDLESQEIGKEFHAKLMGIFEFGDADRRTMFRVPIQGLIDGVRNR
jgi:hypothetical protein